MTEKLRRYEKIDFLGEGQVRETLIILSVIQLIYPLHNTSNVIY